MGLLSKHERQNLSAEERRELRKKRRAERPKKGIRININWDGLRASAEDLILDMVKDEIPGPEKMDSVVEHISEGADDFLRWPDSLGIVAIALEAIDGPIIRALFGALVRPQVQKVYERLKADGKI